jgi:hypothetical protein
LTQSWWLTKQYVSRSLEACARALQKLASVTQACSDDAFKGQAQSNADVKGGYDITAQKFNVSALR